MARVRKLQAPSFLILLAILTGLSPLPPRPLVLADQSHETSTSRTPASEDHSPVKKLLSIQIGQTERQILDTLGSPAQKSPDRWDYPECRIEFSDSKVTRVEIELEQAIDPLEFFPPTLQGYLSPIPHAPDTLIPGAVFTIPEQGLEIRLSPGGKSADITRGLPQKRPRARGQSQVSLEEAVRSLQSPHPAQPSRPIQKTRAR